MSDRFDDDGLSQQDRFLQWRHIETACSLCHGSGGRYYGNTSTWRHGVGGASMTYDVCDQCWGSGDAERTWFDVRAHLRAVDMHIAEAAIDLLAKSVGAALNVTHPAIRHIIATLDKIVKKRGAPAAEFLPELAQGLANTLRRAIGEPESKR